MYFNENRNKFRLRQEKLLTQNELADRCDLSKGFILHTERDLTRLPHINS